MNKYFKAVSANLFYFTVNTAFFLIITPVALLVMGAEFFGLWSILNALILFSNIGTLGVASIVNKFASEARAGEDLDRLHLNEVFSGGLLIVLPMAVLTSAALALARGFFANNIQASPEMQIQFETGLLFAAAALIPQFLARVPQGLLLSQLKNGVVRGIETASAISLWIGATLIAGFGRDLVLIAAWCLINSSLMALAYFLAVRRITDFHFRWNPLQTRRMLGFSGFMFVETIAIALFQQVDKIIVGFTLGPAIAGVYSVGTSVGVRLPLIAGQITEVMIPYASLKGSLNDHARLLFIFRRLSRYVSLLVAASGMLLILWMPEILTIWISPDFAAHYSHAFGLLIVAYATVCLCRPAHQTMTGLGRVKLTSWIYLVATAAMLTALFVFSSRLGLLGAALANCVMVLLLAYNLYCYRFLGGRVSPKEMFFDLGWGLLLPGLTFLFVFFGATLWLRVAWAVVAGILLGIAIVNDDWARPWLRQHIRGLA